MEITRQQYLCLGLAGTIILAILTASRQMPNAGPDAPASVGQRRVPVVARESTATANKQAIVNPRLFARDPLFEAELDPFSPVSITPPAAREAVATVFTPVPAAPKVPPFPFRYLGRMVKVDGQRLIYITRGEKILPIEADTRLDNDYRVDTISDDQIQISYLPLNESTIIPITSPDEHIPTK